MRNKHRDNIMANSFNQKSNKSRIHCLPDQRAEENYYEADISEMFKLSPKGQQSKAMSLLQGRLEKPLINSNRYSKWGSAAGRKGENQPSAQKKKNQFRMNGKIRGRTFGVEELRSHRRKRL